MALVVAVAGILLPASSLRAASPRVAPSMRKVAWQLSWARFAAGKFEVPFVDGSRKGHLGLYEPMSLPMTMQKLAGQNTCVTFDDAGVPVVRYDLCPADRIARKPFYNPGTVAALALGVWDLKGGASSRFLALAAWLRAHQAKDGALAVGFPIRMLGLRSGWTSAMYQGEATSVFLRAYQATHDAAYLNAASRALGDLERPIAAGGTTAATPYGPWPEEYAGPHPTSVVNGALTALFGVWEYQVFTGEPQPILRRYLATLARMLPELTVPGWAKYQIAGNDMANLSYMPVQTDELLTLADETGDATARQYGEMWLSDFSGEGATDAAILRAEDGIVPTGATMGPGLPKLLPPGLADRRD